MPATYSPTVLGALAKKPFDPVALGAVEEKPSDPAASGAAGEKPFDPADFGADEVVSLPFDPVALGAIEDPGVVKGAVNSAKRGYQAARQTMDAGTLSRMQSQIESQKDDLRRIDAEERDDKDQQQWLSAHAGGANPPQSLGELQDWIAHKPGDIKAIDAYAKTHPKDADEAYSYYAGVPGQKRVNPYALEDMGDAEVAWRGKVRDVRRKVIQDRIDYFAQFIPPALEDIAQRQARIDALPQAYGKERYDRAKGFGASVGAIAEHPLDTLTGMAAEGAPQAAPAVGAMVAGTTLGGPWGGAAAVGSVALASEYAGSILQQLRALPGVDFNKPETLRAALQNPEVMDGIRSKALRRGIPVAAFNAATAGFAGRLFSAPAASIAGKLAHVGAEIGAQTAGNVAGETAGELASEGKVDAKSLLTAGVSNIVQAAGMVAAGRALGVARGVAGSRFGAAAPEASGAEAAAGRAAGYEDLRAALAAQGMADAGRQPAPVGAALATPSEAAAAPAIGAGVASDAPADGYRQIHYVPVDEITINKDIKQFKEGGDAKTGVIKKLEGELRDTMPPIAVWEKLGGEKEIITGRHRLAKVDEAGKKTIPAYIFKESDGYTKEWAQTYDAESNILDGQGMVKDYARYFRSQGPAYTREEARTRGLLRGDRGESGFILGHDASDTLWDAYANQHINETRALAIARGAPENPNAQIIALDEVRENPRITADELHYMAEALHNTAPAGAGPSARQLGFENIEGMGADFAALKENAVKIARVKTAEISENEALIRAARGAARNPGAARKMGVDINDPASVARLIAEKEARVAWLKDPAQSYSYLAKKAGVPFSMPGDPPPSLPPSAPPSAESAPPDYSNTGALFARRAPLQSAAMREGLAERQARWRVAAERVAPGLMRQFRVEFGSPSELAARGRAGARDLTGREEAAYLANEKIFHLFDSALQSNPDRVTMLNLLHEMGHAHWDTLSADMRARLLDVMHDEVGGKTGPLYTRGRLKQGVAQGVETNAREWYAERIAAENTDWARARAGGAAGGGQGARGVAGAAAMRFRALLGRVRDYARKLRGDTGNLDFRNFLDQSDRFADRPAPARPGDMPASGSTEYQAAIMPRKAASIAEARAAALPLTGRPLVNRATGMVATLSRGNGGLGKMLSASSMRKSASPRAHLTAVANIDRLWGNAEHAQSAPDRAASPDIAGIHRFASVMLHDGKPLGVKITVKQLVNPSGNRLYNIEAVDVEPPKTPKPAVAGFGDAKHTGQLAVGSGAVSPDLRAAPLDGFGQKIGGMVAKVKQGSPEAVEFARRTPPILGGLRTGARAASAVVGRWFTKEGGLPRAAWEAKLARDGQLAEGNLRVGFALRDLHRAVADVYGGYDSATPEQLRQINEVLAGAASPNTIDARLRATVGELRNSVDALSAQFLRKQIGGAGFRAQVDANQGVYLTRSYRIHDDPGWLKHMPEDLRQAAEDHMTREVAARSPGGVADPELVRHAMNRISGAQNPGEGWERPAREGAMDLGILQKRKDIDPVIRAYMGEYKDPAANYARSITSMTQVLANHDFLARTRQAGLGSWLFEHSGHIGPDGVKYDTPLAPEGSASMGPLAGLHTSADIAKAFQLASVEAGAGVWGWWKGINGLAKSAHTIVSPQTQARNFIANPMFMLANGHFRLGEIATVINAVRARIGAIDTPRSREQLARYARLGLFNDSASAGELRAALNDAGKMMTGVAPFRENPAVKGALKAVSLAGKGYQLSDTVYKIYAFENERVALAKHEPAWTPEQVDAEAAERTLNTFPSYSRASRAIKTWNRVGLAGPFQTWQAETLRCAAHTLRYMAADLASANRKPMGAARAAGIAATVAVVPSVKALFYAMHHYTAQDEKDMRRFLPDWLKNSTIVPLGTDGKGRWRLVDLGYMDSYGILRKTVDAFMHGDGPGDSLGQAAKQLAEPFFSESFALKLGTDLLRNRDENDRQIANPQDTPAGRAKAYAGHAWETFEPGVITQGRRVAMGALGRVDARTGRAYDTGGELLAMGTGARAQSRDVAQAVRSKAFAFARDVQDANRLYTEVKTRSGVVTAAEKSEAKAKMETARRALYATFSQDLQAARRLGVSRSALALTLSAAGVSPVDQAMLLSGAYRPYIDYPFSRSAILQSAVTNR